MAKQFYGERIKALVDTAVAHYGRLGDPRGAAIVNCYLPGFADNAQAKQTYGLTFKTLAPMAWAAGCGCERFACRA